MSAPPAVAARGAAAERLVQWPLVRHHSQRTDFSELLAELLPGLTPIRTHIHVPIEAPRGDYVRSRRMGGEPVHDRVRLHRQAKSFPRLATIDGALDRA